MMSKRRVIDLASTKKKDNMALHDYNTPANTQVTVPGGPIGTIRNYLWAATARDRQDTVYQAARSTDRVYWKGISETLSLTCTTSQSWKWRRIVFENKGYRPENTYTELSNGNYRRTWNPTIPTGLADKLFEGKQATDWTSVMTAKPDSDWAKIHYDKTRVLKSGNDAAHEHPFKMYLPIEKMMVYDEDENGGAIESQYWATTGIKGMGDLYIADYFECIEGASTDTLSIRSATTVYWHEK